MASTATAGEKIGLSLYGDLQVSSKRPRFPINIGKSGNELQPNSTEFVYSSPPVASFQRALSALFQTRAITEVELMNPLVGKYVPTKVFTVRWETIPNPYVMTSTTNYTVYTTLKTRWSNDVDKYTNAMKMYNLSYEPSDYRAAIIKDEVMGRVLFTGGGTYGTLQSDSISREAWVAAGSSVPYEPNDRESVYVSTWSRDNMTSDSGGKLNLSWTRTNKEDNYYIGRYYTDLSKSPKKPSIEEDFWIKKRTTESPL